jgi:hypothetical protein
MAPLETPRKQPQPGLYSSTTIPILVGPQQEAFYVHYAFLEKSKFFELHPRPSFTPSLSRIGPLNSPALSETTLAADESATTPIKEEAGQDTRMSNDDAASTFTTVPNTSIQPIQLIGSLYDPAAFGIIVANWYNMPPVTPRDRKDFMVHRKAYILALRYGLVELQDDLVDCCRNFHTRFNVQFDDLMWFAQRVAKEEIKACYNPMVRYLIDQVVYEILTHGYSEFVSANYSFEVFLINDKHVLRKWIFSTMASAATIRNRLDPAHGMSRWRVRDILTMEDEAAEQGVSEETTAFVEID